MSSLDWLDNLDWMFVDLWGRNPTTNPRLCFAEIRRFVLRWRKQRRSDLQQRRVSGLDGLDRMDTLLGVVWRRKEGENSRLRFAKKFGTRAAPTSLSRRSWGGCQLQRESLSSAERVVWLEPVFKVLWRWNQNQGPAVYQSERQGIFLLIFYIYFICSWKFHFWFCSQIFQKLLIVF